MSEAREAIIIGAGHNGLVAAGLLARKAAIRKKTIAKVTSSSVTTIHISMPPGGSERGRVVVVFMILCVWRRGDLRHVLRPM